MFNHILIPLDGSKLAEAVLPPAVLLAQHLHIPITLLHVVEPTPPATIHGDTHLANAQEAEQYLSQVAAQLTAEGVQVDWHVDVAHGGEVAKAIFAHGGELTADLIVLANHGQGGLRDFLFGSIAQQVLQSGQIPVLLVKVQPEDVHRSYKCGSILVPLDSREVYEPALDTAAQLAQACDASLSLVVVVPTLSTLSPERSASALMLPSSTQAMLDLAQVGAAEYLQDKIKALRARGIEATGVVERGDVVSKIIEARERASADLVVMATHGRAGLGAFWSGSVAPKVLSRAHVPVLLLRVTGAEPVR